MRDISWEAWFATVCMALCAMLGISILCHEFMPDGATEGQKAYYVQETQKHEVQYQEVRDQERTGKSASAALSMTSVTLCMVAIACAGNGRKKH